jgi:hypothetical protein
MAASAPGSLQLEWLTFLGSLDAAAPDALNANPHSFDRAVLNDLDALQVWAKRPPGDARGLTADPA